MREIFIPQGLWTKRCLLGTNLSDKIGELIQEYWPDREIILVADGNTWEAAGREIQENLSAEARRLASPIIFPAQPQLHADYCYVQELIPRLHGRAPVAVGSGTINDLVKCASSKAKTGGYLCVATALSVDGYTSAGASLTVDGFKQTVPCDAPLVILADNNVLAKAPQDMTGAGYADLAAKIVAGADWLLADQLGSEMIEPVAWDMVQKNLRQWLADPEGLLRGDSKALEGLFAGLAYTGFSMQYTKTSRPASGAEHMMSHIWEMRGLKHRGQDVSHGFKVAIGTLIVTALYQETFRLSTEELADLLEHQPLQTADERITEIDTGLAGTPFYENAKKISLEKFLSGSELLSRRQAILQSWSQIKKKTLAQIMPFSELRERLQAAHCPIEPADIGLSRKTMLNGIIAAGMIRDRYSILDLLAETGLRDYVLDSMLTGEYFHQYADIEANS